MPQEQLNLMAENAVVIAAAWIESIESRDLWSLRIRRPGLVNVNKKLWKDPFLMGKSPFFMG
jgi:hypothetical protein